MLLVKLLSAIQIRHSRCPKPAAHGRCPARAASGFQRPDAGEPDEGVLAEASLLFADITTAAATGANILNDMLQAEARRAD